MNNDTEKKPVNQGRRRLAQGGLAGSVVLASLISKHALASVPYHCTKSGKFSGTNSTYGPPSSAKCDLGKSASAWISILNNGPDPRTFFGIFGVPQDNETATLLQILEGTESLDSENPLAQQAIVLYLNAELYGNSLSAYPLTQDDVIKMFGCVYGGKAPCTVYTEALGPTVWEAEDIRNYFELLYH